MKWQPSPMMRPPPRAGSCVQWSGGMYPALTFMFMHNGSLRPANNCRIFATWR